MKKLRTPDGPGYRVIAKKTTEDLFKENGLNIRGRTLLKVNFDRSNPYVVPRGKPGSGATKNDLELFPGIPKEIFSCEYKEVIHTKDANCVSSRVGRQESSKDDMHRLVLDLPMRPTGLESAYLENIIGSYALLPSKRRLHSYAEELESWLDIISNLAKLGMEKRLTLDKAWVAISLAEGHGAVRLTRKKKDMVTYDHNPLVLDEKYTTPLPVKEQPPSAEDLAKADQDVVDAIHKWNNGGTVGGPHHHQINYTDNFTNDSYTQSDAAKCMVEYAIQRQIISNDNLNTFPLKGLSA